MRAHHVRLHQLAALRVQYIVYYYIYTHRTCTNKNGLANGREATSGWCWVLFFFFSFSLFGFSCVTDRPETCQRAPHLARRRRRNCPRTLCVKSSKRARCVFRCCLHCVCDWRCCARAHCYLRSYVRVLRRNIADTFKVTIITIIIILLSEVHNKRPVIGGAEVHTFPKIALGGPNVAYERLFEL